MTPLPQHRVADGASSGRRLATLFLAALAVRWIYVGVTVAIAGFDGLKIGDSYGYLETAATFAKAIAAGRVSGWDWLSGPDLSRMPLFTLSITAHAGLAGAWAPLTFTLAQGVMDAATCLFVYGIARAFDPRFAVPAGYAAALTPTLIVLSGVVYTDTAFVMFAAMSLFGAVRWLEAPAWRWALVTAGGLAFAAVTRVWIATWIVPLVPFLALAALARRKFRAAQCLHLAAIVAALALALSPVLLRNHAVYGVWSLTPQSGVHLAMWIAPLVREAKDGTPRKNTVARLEAQFVERYGKQPHPNPFEQSARYRALGEAELRDLGLGAVVKAWASGAIVNLASPAATIVPAIATLPRTGYYDTPGRDFVEKVKNFLFRSENALYAWILLLGIAGVAVARVVQLCGALRLLFRKATIWPALLLYGWVAFVLLIDGPIASPKYRLPIEPVFAVFFGAAIAWRVRDRPGPARRDGAVGAGPL